MVGHSRRFCALLSLLAFQAAFALPGFADEPSALPKAPDLSGEVSVVAPPAAPLSQPAAVPEQGDKGIQDADKSSSVAILPGTTSIAEPTIIYVDNDDEKAAASVEETMKWEELPDKPGQTKITTGARFPVRVVSELNSKTAKVGDPVEGQLRVDLRIGGRLIAPKGTRVIGHVFSVQPARRVLVSELSPHRWWRANGEIGIQFDQIITKAGEHIPLEAKPARQPRIVENKNEGRIMGVNHQGEVASPLSIQLKHQALHLAIRGAASAASVFSMGAVPVAYAAVGALNPSFAFLQPVGKNVPHRRLKGAAMGFISGAPGGFLIADMIIKGAEARIKPGDEFLVEFKQDFTGEPGGDAEMMAGGTRTVKGEVVGRHKKGDKSDKH
jgi:hypothetical protein